MQDRFLDPWVLSVMSSGWRISLANWRQACVYGAACTAPIIVRKHHVHVMLHAALATHKNLPHPRQNHHFTTTAMLYNNTLHYIAILS